MKSLKQKIMLLCSMLCLAVILTVWFFCSFLLDKAYHRTLQNEMGQILSQAAEIVNENGVLNNIDEYTADYELTLKTKTVEELKALLSEGMCLDISNTKIKNDNGTFKSVVLLEGIGNCELHNTGRFESRMADTVEAEEMRAVTLINGEINRLSPKSSQWIWGTVTDNGYILVLSASLAHTEQAAAVIKKLLIWLTAVIVPVSLLASYLFSGWLTKPIERLGKAARKMAHGEYGVTLPVTANDEIGELTREFNFMASEVEKADKLQKELMANISHDLRTPLTLMKGYAETVRDISGDDKEQRDRQLNIIIDETDRLSGLVNSVLELGKLTSNTQKLNPVSFDISDFCEEIAYKYTPFCEQNDCVLRYDGCGECTVTADPDMLERVFHNLLSNAFKHIGEDRTVIMSLKKGNGVVTASITDHGAGIPPDECDKVFDKYYRARSSEGKEGTGLGLSIVKAILQNHGFVYGVQSTLGVGTSFWFNMPLVAPHEKTV